MTVFRPRRLVLTLALGLAPAGLAAQTLPALPPVEMTPSWQERVDVFLDRGEPEEAVAVLAGPLASSPGALATNWRAARACFQMGVLADDDDEAADWYRRGSAFAHAALSADPDDVLALRWAVATTGSLANSPAVGPRETARSAKETWRLTERLLEVRPDDDVAHSAMGTLNAEILTLTTFERLLARAFLGGLVGKANWEDALGHQRRAVELKPDEALYHLELGKALAWRGSLDEAIQELELAGNLPVKTPLDRVRRDEAWTWKTRFEGKSSR